MSTINERIAEVVNMSGLRKTAFAEKINVSQSLISLICSGKTGVSDRTISDICRVFGVNEIWLRTGDGEMLAKKTREEELAEIFARLQYNDDAKSQLICAIARMPDEAFPAFLAFVKQLCKNLTEEAEEAAVYKDIQLPDPNNPAVIPTPKTVDTLVFSFPHNGKK